MTSPLIHLVDDEEAIRDAMGSLLRAVGYRTSLHPDADSLLNQVSDAEPGCIVLDIRLLGRSGLKLAEQLIARQIRLPVVFMSGHADVPATIQALRLGALDLLQKPVAEHILLDAIERALSRDATSKKTAAELAQCRQRLIRLTPREREVLQGIAHGMTNRALAHAWGVGVRTVEAQRASLFDKLEVRHVLELSRYLNPACADAQTQQPSA